MNFTKTIINKSDYKTISCLGSKYVIHLLPKYDEYNVTCVECVIDHEPTEVEITQLEKEANDYFLPFEKDAKIEELTKYDKSSAVNEFTLFGQKMWLPLEERKSMRQSLIALKDQGIESFTYWNGLTPITMTVAQFESMLDAVEIYALQSFNTTAQHKANIMALENLEEVNDYDFTTGYPKKLSF